MTDPVEDIGPNGLTVIAESEEEAARIADAYEGAYNGAVVNIFDRAQAQLFALAEGIEGMPELGTEQILGGWRLFFRTEEKAKAATVKWFGTDPTPDDSGGVTLWAVDFDNDAAHMYVEGWVAGAAAYVAPAE